MHLRAACFVLLLFVAGCSDSPWTHVAIDGTVTVDGTPIPAGTISFLPAQGHKGPAATALIQQGKFHLEGEDGPTSGPHTVVVYIDVDDKHAVMSSHNLKTPGAPSPSKTRWEQPLEIPAEGHFELPLDLKS